MPMLKNKSEIDNDAIILSEGLFSFKTVIDKLLNGKPEENKEFELLAKGVMTYIRKNKEAYLSDLIETFKVEPSTMIKVLRFLKEKKLIRRME